MSLLDSAFAACFRSQRPAPSTVAPVGGAQVQCSLGPLCYKYAARPSWHGLFVDWGYSSVGRASRSHREGQGFESPYLHSRLLGHTPSREVLVDITAPGTAVDEPSEVFIAGASLATSSATPENNNLGPGTDGESLAGLRHGLLQR